MNEKIIKLCEKITAQQQERLRKSDLACETNLKNYVAHSKEGKKYIKVGVLPVDAYERTGAGGAFGSGCLAGLIKGKPFEEALVWGTVNSASVIGYTGSQKGLLRENEMNIWLERAKSSKVLIEEF